METKEKQIAEKTVNESVTANLKWFNSPKGFGFVVPEGEDELEIDAFLHITTLQKAGIHTLGQGAVLKCEIQRRDKGAMVTKVVELVDAGDMDEEAISAPESSDETYELNGTVKWYKLDKGFGFIIPEDGKKDIFIHKSCLERHNLEDLPAGCRIHMIVKDVPKGREVINFSMIE